MKLSNNKFVNLLENKEPTSVYEVVPGTNDNIYLVNPVILSFIITYKIKKVQVCTFLSADNPTIVLSSIATDSV